MKISRFMIPFTMFAVLLMPGAALAEGGMSSGHHDMHGMKAESHQQKSPMKGHHFTAGWAQTLTDEQKKSVDRMHLELDRKQLVLKAQAELMEKEINVLTAQDNADMKVILSKIDDLMAINGKIMAARYAHIVEMRAVLTPDQRISYDMAVLKRSGIK